MGKPSGRPIQTWPNLSGCVRTTGHIAANAYQRLAQIAREIEHVGYTVIAVLFD